MITLRRDFERRHVRGPEHEMWSTFYPDGAAISSTEHFGALGALDEIRIPPDGGRVSRPTGEAEILTYVYRGALAQEDSTGSSGVVHAGEFQRMIVGPGIRSKETNASRTGSAQLFRISLRPAEVGLVSAPRQQRFAAAQRHNVLCVVASPDGRNGSLPISRDALVYSAVVDAGRHLIHELLPGRSAWLHLIHGEATLQDMIMNPGDGGGLTTERSVSLTAREHSEILLVDLGPAPRSSTNEVVP